jgi:hypothetical protein
MRAGREQAFLLARKVQMRSQEPTHASERVEERSLPWSVHLLAAL